MPVRKIQVAYPVGKAALLTGVALVVVAATFMLVPPIPQWPEYHAFADRRGWFGIANVLDVLSNIPFLLIGWMGVVAAGRLTRGEGAAALRRLYRVLFVCVFLTGVGSMVYHLAPDNTMLVWDRLPMAIGFMALFATVIAEMVDYRWASRFLPLLLALGMGSVIYWAWSEAHGTGDLRGYGLVQFLPIGLILLITALYPAPRHYLRHLFGLIAFYGISKALEYSDTLVFDALRGVVSGHTLKHLVAAGGVLFVLHWIRRSGASSETPWLTTKRPE